jgi:hypothetical protein
MNINHKKNLSFLILNRIMKKPACYTERQLKVIRPIIKDIGERFKISPHDEVIATISLKQIKMETGVDGNESFSIVRYFLDNENKDYEAKRSGVSGSRYFISVKREEYERWKKIAGIV